MPALPVRDTSIPVVLAMVVALLAPGCLSAGRDQGPAYHVDVTTRYAGEQPGAGPEPHLAEGSAAEGGQLLVLLLDAAVHPTSRVAGNANGSGAPDDAGSWQTSERSTGAAPVQPRAVEEGAFLALEAGQDQATFLFPLGDDGRTSFRVSADREHRLRLEVTGAVPGAPEGCVYVQAGSPTYVETVGASMSVKVPFDVGCGVTDP